MARILIAGCGEVGTALGVRLIADNHEVWGLRRRGGTLPDEIRRIEADLTNPRTLHNLPQTLDFVFYTAAASGSSDDAYRAAYVDGLRNLLVALEHQDQNPRRVFFTSSTGVYAQSNGEWVDEDSPTEPWHFSGKRLLEGERLLHASRFPTTVLRLGGIYGPGRQRLIEQVRQGVAWVAVGTPMYTNRIHRDDCVGVLHHLMLGDQPEALYLGVDHEPAEHGVVVRWLASQLGLPPPPVDSSEGQPRRSNKRCRNAKLVATGYVFQYPTFRDGYATLLNMDQQLYVKPNTQPSLAE